MPTLDPFDDNWYEFAGFEECDKQTPGNLVWGSTHRSYIMWNEMKCFELYVYAGKVLDYFYGIMCRKAFGDEYR